MSEEMREMMDELQKMMDEITKAVTRNVGRDATERQRFRKGTDRSLEIFKQMELQQKLENTIKTR